jgi:hypothetical protein
MLNNNRSGKRMVIYLTREDIPATIAIDWTTKEVVDLTGEIHERKQLVIDLTKEEGDNEEGEDKQGIEKGDS